ncbi:MAG: HAD-IA family hydrolase [Pseudomonadota bacterium]
MLLVLFDCDGTLVDSQAMIVAAMNRAFASVDMPPPQREDTLAIVGLSLDQAIGRLVEPTQVETVPEIVAAYKRAFRTLRADPAWHEPLYPGASDVVERLGHRSDVLLGVATGKSRRGLEAVLDLHGLRDRFVTLQTADDAPSKPHPEMIMRALRETGGTPDKCVLIGDTVFDMEMAANAGAARIGVSWGYHPVDALMTAGAQVVVDRFDQVTGAIGALFPDMVLREA